MKTYRNINGQPIIRSCFNCKFFNPMDDNPKIGYCMLLRMMFAYTHEKSLYGIVKTFYLCDNHRLVNEEWLEQNVESLNLKDVLKNKEDI